MDRKALREFTHKVANQLSVSKSNYKQWVFRYTFLELEKDLGELGDITSAPLFADDVKVRGKVYAREDGVLAGREEVEYFLVNADPHFRPSLKSGFDLDFKFADGDKFKKGDLLMELSGNVHDVLAVERVFLNLLMRMCGVATFTRKIVDLVADYDVLVTPTRKTLWGLLDKKAVVLGGGGTHRLNLADSVIVKDTHAKILDYDFDRILEKYSQTELDCRFLEIEVEDREAALAVAKGFQKHSVKAVPVIMLDNMSAEEVSKIAGEIRKSPEYDGVLLEASGGIGEANVVDYAKTGVDILSLGALTNKSGSLDLSFKIE